MAASCRCRPITARSPPVSTCWRRCPPTRRSRIAPGARALIPTGIAIALPAGSEAQVRPRSGLAAKHGVTVLNSPGTIDADYRGEIGVILINHGDGAVRRHPRPAHRPASDRVGRARDLNRSRNAGRHRARQRRVWLDGRRGREALGGSAATSIHIQFAPFHSITSSAATSKVFGTVRPSVLAVLRLMIISNLSDACTGSSPGLAPRRMRST